MIGRSVGPYRVLEPLGSGAMGELWLAEDTRLHRRVALKFIAPALAADRESRDRFLREARAASALDHPNVCAIHGIEELPDGNTCIVMAYYEGRTLDRRLESGPLPLAEAVAVGVQVAEGLARAHAMGIVHRDIKPGNLMVTSDGTVKILDFGIAKMAGAPALTATDAIFGSPGFMAPEQVTGAAVDHRADLWALGVVLYSAISGKAPFASDSVHGSIYAILEREPEPLAEIVPGLPPALDAIVSGCLRKRPEDRCGSARDVAASLRAALRELENEPAAASLSPIERTALHAPASTRGRARVAVTPSRRGRTLAGLLAIAALAAVAVAWLAMRPREPLRVAVLPVEVAGVSDSTEAKLATSAAEAGVIEALARLRNVSVADRAELRGLHDVEAMRRAAQADELLRARLEAARDEWQVTIERLSGRDGSVRGARQFRAPQEPALALANALAVQLGNEYPDRRPRGGVAPLAIGDADYAEYVALERAFRARDQGGMTPDVLLERLARLADRAPRFADVHLLRASFAMNRFLAAGTPALLDVASASAERARRLAPDDARPLALLFRCALVAHDSTAARARLAELKRRAPGDVEVLRREAELADAQGRSAEARAALLRAVNRRPARTLIQALADLEVREGLVREARGHLDTLIQRFPDDRYPRSKLAQVELVYGDLGRADSIYSGLIADAPGNVVYLSNRGVARMLRGRFAEAAADFRSSLALSSDNPAFLLNLADVQQLSGARDSASACYARVVEQTAVSAGDAATLVCRAQALAHLGRGREAVTATLEALRTASDDSDVRYAAALVYAVTGDMASAQVNAIAALDKGVGARWFALPWFAPLRRDPEFARRLKAAEKAPEA